jgi:hypothetical protein
MDTVTYPDPRVADFIDRHFAPVKLPVKEHRDLVDEYLVSWTPNLVIADDGGRVHYRIEGYLPPAELVARLSLAAGKWLFNREQYPAAADRFEEVAQRHRGTEAAAEALYWLGPAAYKQSHDPAPWSAIWSAWMRIESSSDRIQLRRFVRSAFCGATGALPAVAALRSPGERDTVFSAAVNSTAPF